MGIIYGLLVTGMGSLSSPVAFVIYAFLAYYLYKGYKEDKIFNKGVKISLAALVIMVIVSAVLTWIGTTASL